MDDDRLPKLAKQMIIRLAEEAAAIRKNRSPSARMRQTSLPQLQPKKVQVQSQSLRKLVQKSKQDFFGKRNSTNQRMRSSRSSLKRQQPMIRHFQSQVDKMLKHDSKKGLKRRIQHKLQQILAEQQPQLASNLREIQQYNSEKRSTVRKSKLVQVNVDLSSVRWSRFTIEHEGATGVTEKQPFRIPVAPSNQTKPITFAVYHTKDGPVEMPCEQIGETNDKVRIRFINGFEKWVKKPAPKHAIIAQNAEQDHQIPPQSQMNIQINQKMLKDTLKKVVPHTKSSYSEYLTEQLSSNYRMSMNYFQYTITNKGFGALIGNKHISTMALKGNEFKSCKNIMDKIVFGSQDLNFVKDFTLVKTSYTGRIIDAYVVLKKIEEFGHFQGFMNSFSEVIAINLTPPKKIKPYLFKKKQEFELLIYELESIVTNLNNQMKLDIVTKINANSRLQAIPYAANLRKFIDNLTSRINILLKSHTLRGVTVSLKKWVDFYKFKWDCSINERMYLPKLPVYFEMCQEPHPLKYKPLIEIKLEYKRLKRIKRKNTYKYILQLRSNLRQGIPLQQARVYCRTLQSIEEEFLLLFQSYLTDINSLENVSGCINNTVVGFQQSPEIVADKKQILANIAAAYQKVNRVCRVLSNLELYLADKSYIDEVLELFDKINGHQLIIDELHNLSSDYTLVSSIPPNIYSDLIVLSTTQLKQKVLTTIESIKTRIYKACENKLVQIYERNLKKVIAVQTRIEAADGNINMFLEFYAFFKDKNIENTTNIVAQQSMIIQKLYQILCDNLVTIPNEVIKNYLGCQSWLHRLQRARSDARRKLATASEMFVSTIKETKMKIYSRLQRMIKDLVEVSKLSETGNFRKNSTMCKGIYEELKDLCEIADSVAEKEKIFNLPQSDFTVFKKQRSQFEKYVRLWDFIEKLKDKENIKKMTVSAFSPQDLLNLSRQGLQVVYFIRRNTVNKRLLTLTDAVHKDLSKILQNLPNLMTVLNPCFSETQWLSLFKDAFPNQQKFPSFYEMPILSFEETGILEHPQKIYQHYRVALSDFSLTAYFSFFEYALKHMDFTYCIVEENEMIVISSENIISVINLKEYFGYLTNSYFKNSRLQSIHTFLKLLVKALKDMQIALKMLQDLWCIFKFYIHEYIKDEYFLNRDTLTSISDDYSKKTQAIKKFSLYFLYEDKSKFSFSDSVSRLQDIKLVILSSLDPLIQRYPFLQPLDRGCLYELLAQADKIDCVDHNIRRMLLPSLAKISLIINDNGYRLKSISTIFDETIEFEKDFKKVAEDGNYGLGVVDIYQYLAEEIPKAIKSECLKVLSLLYSYQFDVAQIYDYYATSHTPLQSVLLAMLIQFNLTFICISQSKSDIIDFKNWLFEKSISKSIPSQPLRKVALQLILGLVKSFIQTLNHFSITTMLREQSYEFITMPKMIIFRKSRQNKLNSSIQLRQWSSKTKAHIDQEDMLFSKVIESPLFQSLGFEFLKKYNHQSQLGPQQSKILNINTIKVDDDIQIGLESSGQYMIYRCNITEIRIPAYFENEIIGAAVVCSQTNKILLTKYPLNEFMLGRKCVVLNPNGIFDICDKISKVVEESGYLVKIRINKLDFTLLNKLTRLPTPLKSRICIQYPNLNINELLNLPQDILSFYKIVLKQKPCSKFVDVLGQQHMQYPDKLVECVKQSIKLYDFSSFSKRIKGVQNNALEQISIYRGCDWARISGSMLQAINSYCQESKIVWDSRIRIEYLHNKILGIQDSDILTPLAAIQTKLLANKPFFIIHMCLYEYTRQELFGKHVVKTYKRTVDRKRKDKEVKDSFTETIWERGLLQKLLDDVEKQQTQVLQDNFYINTFYSELSTGKSISEKQRIQTTNDWFVWDLSMEMPNNKIYLEILDWLIASAATSSFCFGSGRSYMLSQRSHKLIIKLPRSGNFPVSIPTLPFHFLTCKPQSLHTLHQLQKWSNQMLSLNPQFKPYLQLVVPITQQLFSQTHPTLCTHFHSPLTFKQHFSTLTHLLTIFLNEARKFYIAQGFYNYTELSQQDKKRLTSPVDLRGVSSLKDDIEELHEIGRQEKELENSRKVLFKDLMGFMGAVLPKGEDGKQEAKGMGSKAEMRLVNCVQSVAVFCFFWAFCGQVDRITEVEITNGIIRALEKVSKNFGLESFSFNLKELHTLYKQNFSLKKFIYSLQKQNWLAWREVPMPTVQAISSSFSDKILKPLQLVRLNPHSNNIQYIKNEILYLSDNNDFYTIPVNTHSNQITEYLVKFMIAYGKPVHLSSSNPYRLDRFQDYLKKQLNVCNNHRVLPICIKNEGGVVEFIKSKIKYTLSPRWAKFKNRFELADKPCKTFIIVQDINFQQQSYPSPCAPIKSLCDYTSLKGQRMINFSVLLLAQSNIEHMQLQSLSHLSHEDCETHTLTNIFNTHAEGFKANSMSVFEFICVSSKMRDLLESLRLYSQKIDMSKNLLHLDGFANTGNLEWVGGGTYLKKLVEERNKLEVEYYKFLKGEAVKDFGKEERPFETERMDREMELTLLESKISEVYKNIVAVPREYYPPPLFAPKYLLDPKPEQSPRKRQTDSPTKRKEPKGIYRQFLQVQNSHNLYQQLSSILNSYFKVHKVSERHKFMILKNGLQILCSNLLSLLIQLEINSSNKQIIAHSLNQMEYSQLLLRIALMIREKASQLQPVPSKKIFKLQLTEQQIQNSNVLRVTVGNDTSKWFELLENTITSCYTTLNTNNFTKHLQVVFILSHSPNKFISYVASHFVKDNMLADKCIPSSFLDKNTIVEKYRGQQQVFRSHILSMMREKTILCYVANEDYLDLPSINEEYLKIKFNPDEVMNIFMEQPYEIESQSNLNLPMKVFMAAYRIYQKYFRQLYVTTPNFTKIVDADIAQQLFYRVSSGLQSLFTRRQEALLNEGSPINQLKAEFELKFASIQEQIAGIKLELGAKKESRIAVEQEIQNNSKYVKSSEDTINEMKELAQKSQKKKKNFEQQKKWFEGYDIFKNSKQEFRKVNRKLLQKQVTKDEFYDCPLMLFYVYICNVITDSNYLNQKYSDILQMNFKQGVVYQPHEQMKKLFVKSVSFGRLFIVADTQVIENLSAEQIKMMERIRGRFVMLSALDKKNKEKNRGKVYSKNEPFRLSEEIQPELELLQKQPFNELQQIFVKFLAYCYYYKVLGLKMDLKIAKYTKNIEYSNDKIKLTRDNVRQCRSQYDKFIEKLRVLNNKIADLQNDLQLNNSYLRVLQQICTRNIQILQPAYLFQNTGIYPQNFLRTLQSYFLTCSILFTLPSHRRLMTDQLFTSLTNTLSLSQADQMSKAVKWMSADMFTKLIPMTKLSELGMNVLDQEQFWRNVYAEILREAGVDTVVVRAQGIDVSNDVMIQMSRKSVSVRHILLSDFQNKLPEIIQTSINKMKIWSQENNNKYLIAQEKVKNIAMKLDSIESLRVKEAEYGQIGGGLQIQSWVHLLARYEEIEEKLKQFDCKRNLERLLELTVMVCRENGVKPTSDNFVKEFIRLFNQVKYQFTLQDEYFLDVISNYFKGDKKSPELLPSKRIFQMRRKQQQHKKIISDYDRINETARSYELQLESSEVSLDSIEIPYLNSARALYKKSFVKKSKSYIEILKETQATLNIHDFIKSSNNSIVRIKSPSGQLAYRLDDDQIVRDIMRMFGINVTNTNSPKPQFDKLSIEQVLKYLPHQLLKIFIKAYPFQILNQNSSVLTLLRFERPILCVAANGENNVCELFKCAAEEEGYLLKDLDPGKEEKYYRTFIENRQEKEVAFVQIAEPFDYQMVSLIINNLPGTSDKKTGIIFLFYLGQESVKSKELKNLLQVPLFYMKRKQNIKSELLRLNPKLYASLNSKVEFQQSNLLSQQNKFISKSKQASKTVVNPSTMWMLKQRSSNSKHLKLKLHLMLALFRLRNNVLNSPFLERACCLITNNLQTIQLLYQTSTLQIPSILSGLCGSPSNYLPTSLLCQLLNFGCDNIIYQFQTPNHPLLKIIPDYEDFFTMAVKIPQKDCLDMLMLTELAEIDSLAKRNIGLLRDWNWRQMRERQKREVREWVEGELRGLAQYTPYREVLGKIEGRTREKMDPDNMRSKIKELKEFFEGLIENCYSPEVQGISQFDLAYKDRRSQGLNIKEFAKQDINVQALNRPQSYNTLRRMMRVIRTILFSKFRTRTSIAPMKQTAKNPKIMVQFLPKKAVNLLLRKEIHWILNNQVFKFERNQENLRDRINMQGSITKGNYIKLLYEKFINGELPPEIDISKTFNPSFLFFSALLIRAQPYNRNLSEFRLTLSPTHTPTHNFQTLNVTGLYLKYARLNETHQIVHSDDKWNQLGSITISVAERGEGFTNKSEQELVCCMHREHDLEELYYAAETQGKKGLKEAEVPKIGKIPIILEGGFQGHVFAYINVPANYLQLNDVRITATPD